jgi:hypothetical protein
MATNPNVSSDAQTLNDRLQALHDNGHSYLDPTVQVGLAQNSMSTPNMLATADTFKNALNNTPSSLPSVWSDPILNQKPSAVTNAISTLTNTHGPIPMVPEDIETIQKNMQVKGYGKGLPVGTWNTAWQQSWNQAGYDKLTSPGNGNVNSFNLFKGILNEYSTWEPTVLHTVAAMAHGLTKEVRQVIADVGGEAGNYTNGKNFIDLINPFISKEEQAKFESAQAGRTAADENALGGKVSTGQLSEAQRTQRSIQDLGFIFNLVLAKGMAGSLFKAAGAIGGGVAAGAGEEAGLSSAANILRASKVIAQNPAALVTRSLPEEFANAPRLTVVKSLYNGAQNIIAKDGGKINKYITSPIAARIAPFLEGVASEDGHYLAGKQALASTMRIPLRAGYSAIQNRGALTGIGLLGASEIENKLNAQPIYDATHARPYSGVLGDALNGLAFTAGAAPEALKTSSMVGNLFTKAHAAYTNALGPIGFDTVIRRGLGVKLQDLQNAVGEDFVNDHFIKTKLPQYGASHAAQQAANLDVWNGNIDRGSNEYQSLVQSYEHEILNDPELLHPAVESLVNNKTQWAQMLRNDFVHQFGLNIKRTGIAQKDQQAFFNSLNELKNGPYKAANTLLDPEVKNAFHSSAVERIVEDLRTQQLSQEFGKQIPTYHSNDLSGTTGMAHEDVQSILAKRGEEAKAIQTDAIAKGQTIDKIEAQEMAAQKFPFPPGNASTVAPRLVALHRQVNDFAPNTSQLVRDTRYGRGVVATADSAVAGRANANVYALRHADPTELPNFVNLTKSDSTTNLANKIKTIASRDELGFIKTGKKTIATPEYKTLRNMLNNPSETTGQKMIDAYRSALKAGNKLDSNQVNERINQLTDQFMLENNITGLKYIDKKYGPQTLLRSDKSIANLVAMDPRMSKDKMLASYLTHDNVNGLGTLGFARKDTLTSQDALNIAKKMLNKISAAGYSTESDAARSQLELEAISKQRGMKADTTPLPRMTNVSEDPKLLKLTDEARNVLVTKFGKSLSDLTRLDPVQLASLMWRESRTRAAEAYFPTERPANMRVAKFNAAKAEIARLDAAGYRPVLGTDIGHGYERQTIPQFAIDQRTSLLRKAAMRMGVDPLKVNDLSVSNTKRNNVVDEINKELGKIALGKNGVAPILGDTGDAIYSRLIQGAQSGIYSKENLLERTIRTRQEEKQFKKLIKTESTNYEDIKTQMDQMRAKQASINNQTHQIRDLSLKQMSKILQRPIDAKDITDNPIPGYSPEDAMRLAKRVLVGYAKTPASLVGISKIEDMFRASGAMLSHQTASFFGKAPLLKNFKIGEGPLINTLASLPNDLARIRDKWRFDLNPVFSYRRLAKTNVKAALEGVPPTMNPYLSMDRQGITDKAMNVLNRTMPDVFKAAKDLEPLDKMLLQNDIWNIYNPAHNMAWQAYHLEKMGLSDAEITAKLNKINTYGDRTALERTVNTVFYPFSFNKTLYRNVGGYLFDNPGHAMLINAGFSAYSHANKNNAIGQWIDDHAPLLKEFQKLNAFEHGTGLGQLGGINAPYLSPFMNLFSPQRITPGNATDAVKTITNLIPALSELNTILFNYQPSTHTSNLEGTGVETGKVGLWALKNMEEHAKNLFENQKRLTYQPMMTDQAQVKAGQQTVNMLKTQLAPLMNTGATWPDSPSIPALVRGKKYDASSFGLFAQSLFPSYNPTKGATIALEKNNQEANYVASLDGTPRYGMYNEFQTIAFSAVQKLNKTSDPTTIQNIVNPLRIAATLMAEKDKQFSNFYTKFYESSLGPLEGLSK